MIAEFAKQRFFMSIELDYRHCLHQESYRDYGLLSNNGYFYGIVTALSALNLKHSKRARHFEHYSRPFRFHVQTVRSDRLPLQ